MTYRNRAERIDIVENKLKKWRVKKTEQSKIFLNQKEKNNFKGVGKKIIYMEDKEGLMFNYAFRRQENRTTKYTKSIQTI